MQVRSLRLFINRQRRRSATLAQLDTALILIRDPRHLADAAVQGIAFEFADFDFTRLVLVITVDPDRSE